MPSLQAEKSNTGCKHCQSLRIPRPGRIRSPGLCTGGLRAWGWSHGPPHSVCLHS